MEEPVSRAHEGVVVVQAALRVGQDHQVARGKEGLRGAQEHGLNAPTAGQETKIFNLIVFVETKRKFSFSSAAGVATTTVVTTTTTTLATAATTTV